ncbi:MAG: hypothetical protein JW850_10665 [Thermoflexales bacterium]|nr:hypothetical protein [Thermoflexales bacterium]
MNGELSGRFSVQASSDHGQLLTMRPRVLLVVYDPFMDQDKRVRLSQHFQWQDVGRLVKDYIADIEECSGGLVRYQVVDKIYQDEFPVKANGFAYTAQSYLALWKKRRDRHAMKWIDYYKVLKDWDILARVESHQIDEVWLFAFPYAGLYESTMAGWSAFFCNSPPLEKTASCSRRFVIMGFSYERYGGQMLENFCHRAESIMRHVYRFVSDEMNPFTRFTRYDLAYPGQAEVGDVHHAPNSLTDYDYSNERYVLSRSEDWFNYPNFKGEIREVNCTAWGKDRDCPRDPWTRPHHKWWLKHLPKVEGYTRGVANNWWKYIVDPELVPI